MIEALVICGNAAPVPQFDVSLAVVIAALLIALGAPATAQDQPGADPSGLTPNRATVSVLPWESIDVYAGNLNLTFTDLVLPGNAGFDLRFTRSYNSKRFARWVFGPGFVEHADLVNGPHGDWNPKIITGDGGQHATFQVDAISLIYRTTSYAEYNRNTHTLQLPNGVTYYYNCRWDPDPEDPQTARSNTRFPTKAFDAFGNTIVFTYDVSQQNGSNDEGGEMCDPESTRPLLTGITQYLGGQETREVTLSYNQNRQLEAMAYGARTWTYTWNGNDMLTEAQPPEGAPWQFGYGGNGGGDRQVTTVTTPHGGQVGYSYDFERGEGYAVTERRNLGVRGVPEGVWSFNYQAPASGTTVLDPENDGIRPETRYTFSSGSLVGEGTPTYRESLYDGAVLEREWLTWEEALAVGLRDDRTGTSIYAYKLLPTERVVQRDNRSWSTTHTYHGSDFNDYGQPYQTVEGGEFTRTITREFWSSTTRYIRAKVAAETVTGDGQSYSTSATFNDLGFKTAQQVHGVETTFQPDGSGNVDIQTDANNHTTDFDYSWGVVTAIYAPEHTTIRTPNEDGTIADESRGGYLREFSYDNLGREINRTLSFDGQAINDDVGTEYDPEWVKTTRGSAWTTALLDGFGRTYETENAVGVRTSVEHNAWGGRSYESYPYTGSNNTGTTLTYDGLGRLTQRTNPDSTRVAYAYDGITVTITDEKNRDTVQVWEAAGDPSRARLASVTDADNETTEYAYDVLGALISVRHPDESSRGWSYASGTHHLQSETHPESGSVSYEYDAVGNLTTRTDAEGKALRYDYDDENRLVSIRRLVGGATPGTPDDVWFSYDPWGNRDVVENGYVSRVYAFSADWLEEVREYVCPQGTAAYPDQPDFLTTYGYDGNDNLTSITYPASGRVVQYDYDAGNRISKVYENGGPTYADGFEYHPSGGLARYTSGNGVVNTVTYDGRYRPDHIGASGNVLGLTYGYDDVGNVESVTGAPSGTQSFGYDDLDRLTSATGPWGTEAYRYDRVGNRTWKNYPSGTSYDYTGNRLTETTGVEAESFGYDDAGNLTADGLGSYTFTAFDMMRTALVSGQLTIYGYDGDHLRTMTTASGVTRYSLHGPGSVVLTELKEEGDVRTWARDYIYAGTRLIASVTAPATAAFRSTASQVSEGAGTVSVEVVLTTADGGPTGTEVSVGYATRGDTATSGADFTATTGTLTFPAGSANGAVRSIVVSILQDSDHEPSESFTLSLSGAGTGEHTVTISDDDPEPLTFTDDPLQGGVTLIRAVHFTELRARIDDLRTRYALGAFTWTDTIAVGTPIRAVHVSELRTALGAVYQARGQGQPSYTDPTVVAGTTGIKAVHVSELRAAIRAVW